MPLAPRRPSKPEAGQVRDHHADDDQRPHRPASLAVSTVAITIADSGSFRNDTTITPMPTATAGASGKPGRCDARDPAGRAEEDRGERRAAPERREAQTHTDSLAQHHHQQHAHRPGPGVVDQPGERVLAREQHLLCTVRGGRLEQDHERGNEHAGHRHPQQRAAGYDLEPGQADPAHHLGDDGAGETEHDRPADQLPGDAEKSGSFEGHERVRRRRQS